MSYLRVMHLSKKAPDPRSVLLQNAAVSPACERTTYFLFTRKLRPSALLTNRKTLITQSVLFPKRNILLYNNMSPVRIINIDFIKR